MRKRAPISTFPLVAAALLFAGCSTAPERAPAPKPELKPQQERPWSEIRDVGDDFKKPYVTGDYIVYPLKWRKVHEVAPRIYALLYPKYGPHIQIVPDEANNALLIYVPPRHMRFQEMEWRYYGPYIEEPYY